MDYLDELDVKARRATARARQLAARLRAAGVRVTSVEAATLETDAAVNLGRSSHIQVGVDGTYTRVTSRRGAFTFHPAARSATGIVTLLVGRRQGAGGKKSRKANR